MTRSAYLSALMRLLTPAEIMHSAAHPSAYMSRTHIALHHIALRRLGFDKTTTRSN